MGTILAILQWAIPGGGIGAAIAWLANRKSAKVRESLAAKDVHDTFKSMYDDVSALLEKTQKKYEEIQTEFEKIRTENGNLKRAINGLKKAIQAIQKCPHNMQCPVRNELSVDPDDSGSESSDKGQCVGGGDVGINADNRSGTPAGGHGSAGSNDPAAGSTSDGSKLHADK